MRILTRRRTTWKTTISPARQVRPGPAIVLTALASGLVAHALLISARVSRRNRMDVIPCHAVCELLTGLPRAWLAGRARVVFGNRRWGSNGYVASGRAYARPAPSAAASSSSSNAGGGRGKGGSKGAAFKGVADVFGTSPPCKRGGAGAALMGSSPGAGTSGSGGAGPSGSGASGSTPGSGRRAKRNARRAQTAGGLAGDWDEE